MIEIVAGHSTTSSFANAPIQTHLFHFYSMKCEVEKVAKAWPVALQQNQNMPQSHVVLSKEIIILTCDAKLYVQQSLRQSLERLEVLSWIISPAPTLSWSREVNNLQQYPKTELYLREIIKKHEQKYKNQMRNKSKKQWCRCEAT